MKKVGGDFEQRFVVVVVVLWVHLQELSVEFSKYSCKFGLLRTNNKIRLLCETSPLARAPSTASLWMACEITPLFKRSPNLPSYPHVLRIALFWIAREPCFSLYAFQLSTWYERIQNVADLLLRSMVIFSPTRDGHESVPRHVGIHIGRSRTLVGHERMP